MLSRFPSKTIDQDDPSTTRALSLENEDFTTRVEQTTKDGYSIDLA